MEKVRTRKTRTPAPFTFDVTCVIGTVEVGEGEESPHVVAFKMIAEHDAPGTYTFPHANGGTTRVTVEYDDPQADGERPWTFADGS